MLRIFADLLRPRGTSAPPLTDEVVERLAREAFDLSRHLQQSVLAYRHPLDWNAENELTRIYWRSFVRGFAPHALRETAP